MYSKIKMLALGTVLVAASASVAKADTIAGNISIAGANSYNSTSISFIGKGDVKASNGTLASMGTCNECVTLTNFSFDSSFTPTTVFTATNIVGGVSESTSLLLTSIDTASTSQGLYVTGTGVLSQTGYEDTTGTFIITSQGVGTTTNVSFSASAGVAPTPEPSTLLLLGTGLVGSAGALYRRRRLA